MKPGVQPRETRRAAQVRYHGDRRPGPVQNALGHGSEQEPGAVVATVATEDDHCGVLGRVEQHLLRGTEGDPRDHLHVGTRRRPMACDEAQP